MHIDYILEVDFVSHKFLTNMEIIVTLLPPIYRYCLLSHPAWCRVLVK